MLGSMSLNYQFLFHYPCGLYLILQARQAATSQHPSVTRMLKWQMTVKLTASAWERIPRWMKPPLVRPRSSNAGRIFVGILQYLELATPTQFADSSLVVTAVGVVSNAVIFICRGPGAFGRDGRECPLERTPHDLWYFSFFLTKPVVGQSTCLALRSVANRDIALGRCILPPCRSPPPPLPLLAPR